MLWSAVALWADVVCEVGNGGVNTCWIAGLGPADDTVSARFESALACGDCNSCRMVDVGFFDGPGSATGRSP